MTTNHTCGSRIRLTCGLTILALLIGLPVFAGEKTVDIEWSGQYRARGEYRIDADLDSETGDQRTPILQRVRLGAKVKANDQISVFAQIQDSRVFGEEASTASNEANVDLHQGYMRINASESFQFTVGRQEWNYGGQRLIGAFGWNNVGRAFDGVRARAKGEKYWVDGFWGRLARFTDPGVDEENRDLFGLYGHFDFGNSSIEPYTLVYRTGDELASEIPDITGKATVYAFGARFSGKWNSTWLKAEGTIESGDWGNDDLSAYAVNASAGHRFGEVDGWVEPVVGFDYATGDEDSTDGERGEFFNFFPTNHAHYGYLDMFGWRNIQSPWVGVRVGGKGHWFQAKWHRFWLDEEAGRWSSAGGKTLGFDPTGESGDDVGSELNFNYKRKLFSKLGLHVGYAYFTPGDYAKATRGEDAAHFAYAQGTVNF